MNKPNITKEIVTLLVSSGVFICILAWWVMNSQEVQSQNTVYGYLAFASSVAGWYLWNLIRRYNKEYKDFVTTIMLIGKKEQLVDYQVTSTSNNGVTRYYIEGAVVIAGKEHKIREQIPQELGVTFLAAHPVVDMYYDPTNSNSLVYHLDITGIFE